MAKWPKDTMKAKIAFYGDPRGPHGVNNTWFSKNVIRVTPPYKMFYAGKSIKTISFHKKCVESLSAALDEIWESCDKDPKKIAKYGLEKFADRSIIGSFVDHQHSPTMLSQ